MSASTSSERGLISTLLQDPDPERLFQTCEAAGVTESSFVDPVCINVWTTAARIRAERKPCILPVIMEEMHGDQSENMMAVSDIIQNYPPSVAFMAHYIKEIRSADHDRVLLDKARMAVEALSKGGGGDVVAEQLRQAGEAYRGGAAGGPLVATFPPMTFSYLRDLEIKPEENHIAGKGWLRRGSWTLFTGGTGIGKSVAVQQMAACVACGKSFFGLTVMRPFKVLLLTAEQDEETLQRDFVAIAEHENLSPVLLDQNLQVHHAYALDGPPLFVALEEEMKRGAFDLVVLDNYQAYSGATDLNDSAAWVAFIGPLSRMLKVHNASLLLVDHTGKPRERKGWGQNDSVYVGAGTSRKANGARTSAELYSPADGDSRYRLHFGKNWERTGRVARDLYLDRSPDATSPYWTPSLDQADHSDMVEGEREILAHATDHPFDGVRKIEAATGYSKSKVQRVLAKHPLLSHGREEKL